MNIGEVATAAARDANLLADTVGVFEHEDLAPALAGLSRTKESGRPCPDYYDIEFAHVDDILTSALSHFHAGAN